MLSECAVKVTITPNMHANWQQDCCVKVAAHTELK